MGTALRSETHGSHRSIDTSARVETPEHIAFSYPLAGPAHRALAYLIDFAIRGAILFALVVVSFIADLHLGADGMSEGALLVLYFALDWFYFVLFETIWSGRSPGKRALNLRVVGEDGRSLTVLDSVLRNLLRAVDMLPALALFGFLPMAYAVGIVVMALDPKFRRIGDLVAGTVVVVEDYSYTGAELVLEPPASAAELAALPVRPPLSRRELDAIELFLRRQRVLSTHRSTELAELIAPEFAARMALRYHDPARFLGLLWTRARARADDDKPAQAHAGRGRGRAAASQDEFVAARRESWKKLEQLLLFGRDLRQRPAKEISALASAYRSVCADLMRARSQHDAELVRYLDGLAGRAHNLLYGARSYRIAALWELLAHEFPQTLRRRWVFFALASALFYLPLLLGLYGSISSPEFAQTILPPGQLMGAEAMYEEGIDGRAFEEDSMMAGYYVYNNVGIAFRCFATGALLGLGSLFFTIYNGLVIGTTLGWVTAAGHGHNIFTFVCGHGPFELTAIVISAGAGLQMGWALVATGGRTRLGSLRHQARELGALIVGAGAMLVIAALIEGYWSPSSVSPQIKWAASAVSASAVIAWLSLGGRKQRQLP